MDSDFKEPINIGSEEMVTINALAMITMGVAGKTLQLNHIDGPLGVRGRNSDNTLLRNTLGWEPEQPLETGIALTYAWIKERVLDAQERN